MMVVQKKEESEETYVHDVFVGRWCQTTVIHDYTLPHFKKKKQKKKGSR